MTGTLAHCVSSVLNVSPTGRYVAERLDFSI